MITTLLLNLLYYILQALFGLLSTAITFVGLNAGLQSFFSWVYQFNNILPVDTAYRFLGYTVGFWLAVFLFEFVKWVLHLIRGN